MRVAIRCDSGVRLGQGHSVRCTALAQALQSVGAQVLMLGIAQPGDALGAWRALGLDVAALPDARTCEANAEPWLVDEEADARNTLAALRHRKARVDWLVLDHYGLGMHWESVLRPSFERLLVLDDLANRPHLADLLVDMAPGLLSRYDGLVPKDCRRLLGPRYALLRPEFQALAQRIPDGPRHGILACMGGTDPLNALSTVLAAWQRLPVPRPSLQLAVGETTPHLATLRARCDELDGVTLLAPCPDIARRMATAALFVGSAGGVSWERCALGLPAVMAMSAENQRPNLAALLAARTGTGIAPGLAHWKSATPEMLARLLQSLLNRPQLLARQSQRARQLVDGLGARRVAVAMAAQSLNLRRAAANDSPATWPWRNHPETRRYFHDPRPVPEEVHQAWWTASLKHPQRHLFIVEIGTLPVGVLRLDDAPADRISTVSIYLDPNLTGLGLGTPILRAAQSWLNAHQPGWKLRAEIHPHNAASLHIFQAAGFQPACDGWCWQPEPTPQALVP